MAILEYTFNLIIEAEGQQQQEAPPPEQQGGEAPPQPPAPPQQQGGGGEPPPQKQPPQEAPQREESPLEAKPVKVPPKIKSFISKMVKDFGPDGSASVDMKFMRKSRETLGVTGGKVSKIIEKIKDGATPEELYPYIKPDTDKY